MTSFMGPMAPPPAAPAQPQALDIRTDPNQRQQFKQFMRQRTSMAPMVSAPIAQPQPPMPMMQSPAMFNMGGGVDIFDPMYSAPMMAPSAPMGFKEGGSTQPIEQRVMKNGQIGLFRGQTFLGFKQEPEKKEESPLLSLAKFKEVLGFEDGGSVPSTLPRSKKDAIAQKVAEMMAISAERVRAAQQNAEYNRLLRDQDAIDRQVALDRLKADQAESRQNMTLDSILSDIDYERRVREQSLLRKEDGGAVPPRRTDIRGQDHMLSYITPDEADILKALGGSGEAGPMGIPAFPPGFGDDPSGFGSERAGGAAGGSSGAGGSNNNSGSNSPGNDSGNDGGGMSPGRSQAQFGTTEFAGKSEQEAQNIVDSGGGSDQAQAVQQSIATQQAAAAEVARQAQVREAEAAAQARAQQAAQQIAQDSINRTRDRVQAGLAQTNIGTGPMPEVNLTATSAPPQTSFNVADTLGTGIASTVNTGPRDTRGPDAGRTDLLGLDDLLVDQFTERGLVTDATPQVNQTVLGGGTDNMNLVNTSPNDLVDIGAAGLGVDVPTSTTTGTTPTGTATTTSAPIGMDDEYDDVVGTPDYDDPNREGYSAGLPTGLDFVDTPQGRMTTNLAGTTAAQRAAMPGYMNTRNEDGSLRDGIVAGLTDFALGNPVRNAYGFEIPDLATGQITGMTGPSSFGGAASFINNLISGKPEDTEDLLQRGVYTGFGPGSQIGMDQGGDGPDQPVKAPTDPCPDGFVMKNGACTPIDSGSGETPPNQIGGGTPPAYVAPPVIVPSPRQPVQSNLQGPVGYGSPIAGQAAPSVASNAAMYQQMLNQQAMNPPQFMPVRLQQGGAVSSNLDMAADNFLKALMPAA